MYEHFWSENFWVIGLGFLIVMMIVSFMVGLKSEK